MDSEAFRLWDDQGSRLYLTADERAAFRAAARAHDDRSARTFCHLLLFNGCRISEGLEVTPGRFDWQDQAVMFRTLKKRGRKALTTYRAVPLPADFLDELDLIHHLRGRGKSDPKARLWTWSRPTAWRRVKAVMDAAGIEGAHASPKGLRHGFGMVHALTKPHYRPCSAGWVTATPRRPRSTCRPWERRPASSPGPRGRTGAFTLDRKRH